MSRTILKQWKRLPFRMQLACVMCWTFAVFCLGVSLICTLKGA